MPRSPSRNERDRKDRGDRGDRHRPQKDYSNDVAKMKEKMRNTLEIARKSESSVKNKKREELSAEEQLARTKAIQEIEEGGFQPASFRSGSQAKKDQKSKKETSHDAAIFGPAWKSAEQRKVIEKKESDISTISLPTAPPPPMNAMVPMVPSHMNSENDERRKQEWKAYWSEVRHEMIQLNC